MVISYNWTLDTQRLRELQRLLDAENLEDMVFALAISGHEVKFRKTGLDDAVQVTLGLVFGGEPYESSMVFTGEEYRRNRFPVVQPLLIAAFTELHRKLGEIRGTTPCESPLLDG